MGNRINRAIRLSHNVGVAILYVTLAIIVVCTFLRGFGFWK